MGNGTCVGMKLDVTRTANLSVEQVRRLSALEAENRDLFNDFVGILARTNNIAGPLWFLRLLGRNIYVSSLFEDFYKLSFLSESLAGEDYISEILVDSAGMRSCVQALLRHHGRSIPCRVKGGSSSPQKTRVYHFLKSLYISVTRYICRFSVRSDTPKEPIKILDCWAELSDFDGEANFRNRYYPKLLDHLPEQEKDRIWVLPSYRNFLNPFKIIAQLRNFHRSPQKFIVTDSYLSLRDYLDAWAFSIRASRAIKHVPLWQGMDVSPLIAEALSKEVFSWPLIDAFLRYRSLHRMKEAGVMIELAVNWSENQLIDKALNLGLREAFPDSPVHGYYGFVPMSAYLCSKPTDYEVAAGLAPRKAFVMGPAFRDELRQACPVLDVRIAPAYRYLGLYDVKRVPPTVPSILFALPLYMSETIPILHMCKEVLRSAAGGGITVKLHPAYTVQQFEDQLPAELRGLFKYSADNIHTLLEQATCLVSSASGVCLEAAVLGVPVAIFGNRSSATQNPLEDIVSPRFWKICYSADELLAFIQQELPMADVVLSKFFSPITPENRDALLVALP